jgi:hypothetical protein
MPESTEPVRCSRPECDVASTGSCAEGNKPPESCPYYRGTLVGLDDDESADDTEAQNPDAVPLYSGEAITPAEVDEFLRGQPATFVTIVGDRDSGKTTLICAIYDRFLKGPFAGYLFAGSRTLIGLEKSSHYSRADSGLSQPDTAHTSRAEGLRFYHFAVVPKGRYDTRVNLLLSDRAGELYREARSRSVLIPDLVEVAKADRLLLLLDGGRVTDPIERTGAMEGVRQTLRAFLDGGALDTRSIVQIVTTKVDLLAGQPERQALDSRLGAFQERLKADFGHRLGDLTFWDIAARDPRGVLPAAHGIDALFADWASPRQPLVPRFEPVGPFRSEFDRLLRRTAMERYP